MEKNKYIKIAGYAVIAAVAAAEIATLVSYKRDSDRVKKKIDLMDLIDKELEKEEEEIETLAEEVKAEADVASTEEEKEAVREKIEEHKEKIEVYNAKIDLYDETCNDAIAITNEATKKFTERNELIWEGADVATDIIGLSEIACAAITGGPVLGLVLGHIVSKYVVWPICESITMKLLHGSMGEPIQALQEVSANEVA